jgi:hypothetical protein
MIASPFFKPSTTCNLRWFYHMYGTSIGTLNVYTRTSVSGALSKVWTLNGNQGTAWKPGQASINIPSSNFQVCRQSITLSVYVLM